jgi:hypothetical protein
VTTTARPSFIFSLISLNVFLTFNFFIIIFWYGINL